MIKKIINIFHDKHNSFNKYQVKLEELGLDNKIILKSLYFKFIKEYGGLSVYSADLLDTMDSANRKDLDSHLLLGIGVLCSKKRRETILNFYSVGIGYGYDDLTSFIFALDNVEKGIKKTCNLI